MTRKILFHAALTALVLACSAGAFAAPYELKVKGNKVVTKLYECNVRLLGMNVPSLEWTYTGNGKSNNILNSMFEVYDNWNSNMVRLPLCQDRWFGKVAGGSSAAYQALVDSIVATASARGKWVLLDLHWSDMGHWAGYTGSVTITALVAQHYMPDDNSTAFWADVAARYANNPAVLFDLYNEPHGVDWGTWRNGGTVSEDFTYTVGSTSYTYYDTYHSPGMQGLLNTVRAAGANNAVVVGGLDWAFNLSDMAGYELTDTASGNGIILASHIYPWKSADWDGQISGMKAAHPIIISEVGPNENSGGAAWMASVLDWIDANGYSWLGWCFHTGATPRAISDWNYTLTAWEGVPVKARLQASWGGGCLGTPTITPTHTASPTVSPTFTVSPTPTPQPTQIPPAAGDCYIFPSPAGAAGAHLVVALKGPGLVKARIYNAMGELAALVEERRGAGTQGIPLGTGGYAPGVYICRVAIEYDGGGVEKLPAKKFAVAR